MFRIRLPELLKLYYTLPNLLQKSREKIIAGSIPDLGTPKLFLRMTNHIQTRTYLFTSVFSFDVTTCHPQIQRPLGTTLYVLQKHLWHDDKEDDVLTI